MPSYHQNRKCHFYDHNIKISFLSLSYNQNRNIIFIIRIKKMLSYHHNKKYHFYHQNKKCHFYHANDKFIQRKAHNTNYYI